MDVVQDNRADSTLDLIANEELAENEALAAKVEADQQADAAAAFNELADGWRQAVATAGDIVTSIWPKAKPVWTEDRITNLGAALARADEAYGWGGAGSLFSHPLVGVAVAGFPLAVGTATIINEDAKAKKLAKLRESAASAQVAPVIGEASPDGASKDDAPRAPEPEPVKLKPSPMNPGGLPAFGA